MNVRKINQKRIFLDQTLNKIKNKYVKKLLTALKNKQCCSLLIYF